MSFRGFIWGFFSEPIHFSWHAAHIVHQVCILLSGLSFAASAIFGIRVLRHDEEPALLAAPLVTMVVCLVIGIVAYAYKVCKREFDRRVQSETGFQQEIARLRNDFAIVDKPR
jgi:hypothetical protein